MKHLGMKAWALVVGAVAYLFGMGSPAESELRRGIGVEPSSKESAEPARPQASSRQVPGAGKTMVPQQSVEHLPMLAPPEAERIVASYGAPQAGLGQTRSNFSSRGPWTFMPDGSLHQKGKQGGVMIIKRSGEVSVFNSARQQVEKKNSPAAAQFYRVMKRTEDLQLRQSR